MQKQRVRAVLHPLMMMMIFHIYIYICKFYFSSGLFWGIQKFQTSYLEETDVSHHVTLLTAALYRKVKDADQTGL